MKRYLTAVIVVLALVWNVVFAAEATVKTIEYNVESKTLTISGNANSAKQTISLEILAGDVTAEQFNSADAEKQFNMLAYSDETQSAEGGAWKFSFEFPGDSKAHVVRIRTCLKGEPEVYSITTASKEDFDSAWEMINTADKDNVSDIFEKYSDALGLDSKTFMTLPEKNRDAMARRILDERDNQPNDKFTDFESLKAVFNEALAVECVNAADGSDIAEVLEKYATYFDYKNEKAYEIFTDLSLNNQKNVYSRLANGNYSEPSEIDEAFVLATVRERFAAIRGYDELYDVLPLCAEALEADISDYSALSKEKKLKVCAEIVAKLSDGNITKATLEQVVNSAAKKYSSDGSSSGGGSGSSGGGGGSSSGGGQTTSSVQLVTPNEPMDNEPMFNDLSSVPWAAESVELLAKRGVLCGKAEKTFAPEDTVTREEFVKMVVLAFNITAENTDCDFSDVSTDAWYREYIGRAVGGGIVKGLGDGRFGVGESISRQDIAVILWNAVRNNAKAETALTFDDDKEISDYAKAAVNAMRYLKIIDGYEDNTFRPHNAATRAEAAKLLYKAVQTAE
ncbi:MAG: S-layer homology domain-containing protein [Monoglobaceae bacterium]